MFTKYFIPITYSALIVVIISACKPNEFVTNARLPTDVELTCVADISPWFAGGQIEKNGWVNPANSLDPIFADFADNSRCDFYKWGAQMFLWLTSDHGNGHVFNTSPVFYNVSVEENNKRTFLPGNGVMLLSVRKSKTDTEIEMGQAGVGDILLAQKSNSQDSSLVYYGLHANDVFALYTTCRIKSPSACNFEQFPSTQGQLNQVANFASSYGYPLGWEDIALAIELKTSWVDAETVANPGDYVLAQAIVPVFDRANPSGPWPVTGNEKRTLAMVGMHVVGTVDEHPEMIWSTFEHVNNAPDNTYTYTTNIKQGSSFQNATLPYNSSGSWNFIPANAPAPTSLTATGQISTNDGSSVATKIVGVNGADITAVNVMRVDPWGNHGSDSASVANNTDLVSINLSVLSQLKSGDVRGNYIQTGGIWSAEGQIPPGTPQNPPTYIPPDYLRGSLNLANTTMETFYQFNNGATAFNPVNCFGCHGTSKAATEVSHIFSALEALPEKR